jgi:hypothetical protein
MRVLSVVLLVLLVLSAGGCREPMIILPPDVIPGGTVVVRQDDTQFVNLKEISILFGQEPGRAVRIVDEHSFEALIPDVLPGDTQVTVDYGGQRVGIETITVSHPPARRVVLEVSGDNFTLLGVQPYGGRFDPPATEGLRLSYDVLDVDSILTYTGTIRHPAQQQIETFHDPEPHHITRHTAEDQHLFMIKVPWLETKTIVVFYEVRAGVDLTDPGQRQRRRRMAAIRF